MNKYEWFIVGMVLAFTVGLLMNTAEAAERTLVDNEGQVTISYMPLSYHWDRDHDYNEVQHGVGIGLGLGHGFTVGAMRFRNSFGDMTTMAALDKYIGRTKQLHWSYGAGYAWGYKEHMVIPMAAWVSVRWKMVKVSFVPGIVTAVSLVFPLN